MISAMGPYPKKIFTPFSLYHQSVEFQVPFRVQKITTLEVVIMLTAKQQKFCEEYLKCGNATEAYMTAFDGYSRKAAGIDACRMLDRDDIQEYIKRLRKPIEKAVSRRIISEREKKKKIIEQRLEKCIARDDDAAIARYLEIWNKMDGEYVNINKDITERETDIQNLDTKTLLQLVQGTPQENKNEKTVS